MEKYVFIDGKRYKVVDNYILGLDVYGDDSIPVPAVADSGKVLGVNEAGKYALTEVGGGGGGEPIILSFTGSSNNWTTQNTPEEYTAALTAGVPIFLEVNYTSPTASKRIVMNCEIYNNNMYFTERIRTGSSSTKASAIVYELYTDGSDVYLSDTTYEWETS